MASSLRAFHSLRSSPRCLRDVLLVVAIRQHTCANNVVTSILSQSYPAFVRWVSRNPPTTRNSVCTNLLFDGCAPSSLQPRSCPCGFPRAFFCGLTELSRRGEAPRCTSPVDKTRSCENSPEPNGRISVRKTLFENGRLFSFVQLHGRAVKPQEGSGSEAGRTNSRQTHTTMHAAPYRNKSIPPQSPAVSPG